MSNDAPASPAQHSAIRAAMAEVDPTSVIRGLKRSAERFSNGRWLVEESLVLKKPGRFLRGLSPSELNDEHANLADYAASSTVLHCADAWSLLGAGALRLLTGHLSQAVHLIYYSELRSALSLMSSSGVIVNNDVCVVLSESGAKHVHSASAHELLWFVFQEWCGCNDAQTAVSSMLRFEKVPMSRWITIAQKGGSGLPAVTELLRGWGLDLHHMAFDRDSRNLASYNPTHLFEESPHDFGRWARDVVAQLVRYVNPSGPGGFPSIDNALFSSVVSSLVGSSEDQLRRISREVMGSDWQGDRVSGLITEMRSGGPNLVDAAGHSFEPTRTDQAMAESMLGRALILARLATGKASLLQRDAGVELGQFAWWADEVSVRQGFWQPPARPDPLTEMWADMEAGLDELDVVAFRTPKSVYEVHVGAAEGALVATGLARAAVWSLSA